MSDYRKYLEEGYKEYHFRIKTVQPLDDRKMNAIETILRKYDLKDVTSPRRTPIQENPLEFYDISNHEVYIIDAVLGLPASPYVLQQELKDILQIQEEHIVIRGDNDPIEVYTKQLNDQREARERGDEKKARLSTNEEYDTDEQITTPPDYGDEYNQKFLSRVARAKLTVETEIKDENAEFNKGIEGVKPHYGKGTEGKTDLAPTGNYDNDKEIGVR